MENIRHAIKQLRKSLILTWSENCVLTSKAARDAVPAQGGNPAVAAIDNPTNAAFKVTDAKVVCSCCYLINWKW